MRTLLVSKPLLVGRRSTVGTYRRVRAVRIGASHVLQSLFLSTSRLPDYLLVCLIPGIPEGAIVRSVHNDPYSMCFVFIIEHPSFEPVLEGDVAPFHPPGDRPMFEWQAVPTRKEE